MKEIIALFNTPMTLWGETCQVLSSIERSWEDVSTVGTTKGFLDKDEFKKMANESWFDAEPYVDDFTQNGFGMVADDLIIWGNDFWLTRDWGTGYEHWQVHQMPPLPTQELSGVRYLSLVRTDSVDPDFDTQYCDNSQSLKSLNL